MSNDVPTKRVGCSIVKRSKRCILGMMKFDSLLASGFLVLRAYKCLYAE